MYKATRHACLALITPPRHNIPVAYVQYVSPSQHTLVSSFLSLPLQHIRVSHLDYCKCMTFGDVFFLAPLAVVSIRQIKYIAKCASI